MRAMAMRSSGHLNDDDDEDEDDDDDDDDEDDLVPRVGLKLQHYV